MARVRSLRRSRHQITVLAGGVGAAKFLRGLARQVDPARVNVIINTGDDEQFYGLHISPDVDTVTYTLAGAVSQAQGWGLEDDSYNLLRALERFYGKAWFSLGDRDFATHLYRKQRLAEGWRLSEVTADVARHFGVKEHLMPMSDDPVRTFVKVRNREPLPFQEYFVKRRARGAVERIELRGIKQAKALPAALRAIEESAATILAPSNPFVSLGPIIGLRGMREALRAVRGRVAAISPIVGGKTIKGPADRMMRGLGHQVSPLGIASLYRDFVGLFVLDQVDRRYAGQIEKLGMRAVATDTIMTTAERAASLADVVIQSLGV